MLHSKHTRFELGNTAVEMVCDVACHQSAARILATFWRSKQLFVQLVTTYRKVTEETAKWAFANDHKPTRTRA